MKQGSGDLGFLKYLETPSNTENSKITRQVNISKSKRESSKVLADNSVIKLQENLEKEEKKGSLNEEDELYNITPIPALTDSQITDETLIYYHKGVPIYLDFLHINEPSKANEGIISYFEKVKSSLTLRKCKAYF